MKEYFTTHDIALMLNVTRVTVRNWIIKGRLEATTTPGGHRRISRKELTRFMEDNNYNPDIIREYELTRGRSLRKGLLEKPPRQPVVGPGKTAMEIKKPA